MYMSQDIQKNFGLMYLHRLHIQESIRLESIPLNLAAD